jgi:hypothetical protein
MLESEIVKLRQAIEALTATIAAQSPAPVAAGVETQDRPAPEAKNEPAPEKQDAPSDQDIKDATLKASRAGHKDAIRKKLADLGVAKIQDLTGDQGQVFFDWLQTLGENK